MNQTLRNRLISKALIPYKVVEMKVRDAIIKAFNDALDSGEIYLKDEISEEAERLKEVNLNLQRDVQKLQSRLDQKQEELDNYKNNVVSALLNYIKEVK